MPHKGDNKAEQNRYKSNCDVWYVVVIEKHIQCEYLTYATIGITTRLTLPNKRHHWHLHIIY